MKVLYPTEEKSSKVTFEFKYFTSILQYGISVRNFQSVVLLTGSGSF